ncbi:MAG: hypothetical protein LC130_29725 [Bryobacterales bacterium]|nr:hypothetical protein [Bryobacterales bacterium]
MPRVEKAVYPYSVVPGGVWSKEDVARAVQSDTVVADHYAEINTSQVQPVTVVRPARAYVSYKKNGKVYWSSRKISLHQGETLLTDGSQCVRGRCGNRLSEVPRKPVLPPAEEPDEKALNSHPKLIADTPAPNEPVFEFPAMGMRIPVLPRPALISEIASAAPASAILQPAREGSSTGADPGWYLPGPSGIAPLLPGSGSKPGGGTDPVTPPPVQPPDVIIDPENPPDKPAPGGPDPGGEPQAPLPFIPLPPRPPVPPPFVVPPNVIIPPQIVIPPVEPEIPFVPPDGLEPPEPPSPPEPPGPPVPPGPPEPPSPPVPPGPPEISETPEPATLLTIPAGLGLLFLRMRHLRKKTGQRNYMRSLKTLD